MSLLDKLYDEYKIPSHELREGQQKTKCPQCQPQHNPKDNPLSVEVGYDKILFHCHHCGFDGGVVDKQSSGYRPKPKMPEPVVLFRQLLNFFKIFFKAEASAKILMRHSMSFRKTAHG